MMTAQQKTEIVRSHQRHEKDSGSAEIQAAILTKRIGELTEHLKLHKKDHSSRRGLLKMVGKRSALLKYLMSSNRQKYLDTIQKLGLRK
jgi:small subunit ribosomal protein S15